MLFLRWLPVLLWLAVIAYFSNQPFAEQDLRPEISQHKWLIGKVYEIPPVRFSYDGQPVDSRGDPAGFIQFWVRKGAHVLAYGVLGLLLVAALGAAGFGGAGMWLLTAAVLVVVAALDEQHQLGVPGRTGRVLDVLVDLAGFGLVAFLAWLAKLAGKPLGRLKSM